MPVNIVWMPYPMQTRHGERLPKTDTSGRSWLSGKGTL